VKGLARDVKHESFREGGVNDYEHKLVTQVSYPALVLERGFALEGLWKWALAVADGEIRRRNIWVRLQDEAGGKAWAWLVENALPVKWTCSDLDANASPVVMESVEFAHHGLRKGT
jgi:phage tail-like protein